MERFAGLSEQKGGPHHFADRLRGVGRHCVADALAPRLVGQPVEFEVFLRFDERLQDGQLERGERPVPRAIERADHGDGLLVRRGHARISDGPAPVVVAGGGRHCAAMLVPADDAVVAAGEVRVAALAAHTRARVGNRERALAAVAARNDRAGRVVPGDDSEFVVVLCRASVARVCDAEGALPGRFLAGDRAGVVVPVEYAVLLVLCGVGRPARVGNAERSIRGQ